MGFALSYDSPPFGGEREPSPGEAFHTPRSRSWDSSAVVSPETPRADVWGGRGTGVRSLGAGVASVERRVVKCTVLGVGRNVPLAREPSRHISWAYR